MSRRKVNFLDSYSENNFNCIFGLFNMIGSIGQSEINKSAQDNTNRLNRSQWLDEMAYKKSRDEISDKRYEDELAYNRNFAEDERIYQRAFAKDERDYQRAFAEDERDYQRAFAQEQQSYDRQLQQQIFEREDTALARQAEQLSALGINPASQQLNGLGAGSLVSSSDSGSSSAPGISASGSSSAPSSPNHSVSDIPPSFRAQAYTNFALQGLEPSLDFLNQLEGIKTNKMQRDLITEQVNNQRLANIREQLKNMDFARENGIILNPDGTLTFKDKDYNDKVAFKNEEFKQAQAESRSKSAQARMDEQEAYFKEKYGTHNKFTDTFWTTEKTATRMQNALESEIDNGSHDDSSSTNLEDRINQVADENLSGAFAPFLNSREYDYKQKRWNKIKSFFKSFGSGNSSAVYGRNR